MRLPADLPIHAETLLAVVLGAVLATVSGLLATGWEARLRRRDRAKSAALFYGDFLRTLDILVRLAIESRERGDPYGPITVRMLRQIRREFDLYDRNRELLYDLADALLRGQIHALVVRMAMPLDGVLDACDILPALADDQPGRAAQIREAREQGFAFFAGLRPEIAPLVSVVANLAGQPLDMGRTRASPSGQAEA